MASLFRRRKKVDIGGLDELITTSTVGGEENVAANITICDMVNVLRTPEELVEVVEVMRGRLGVRDEAVLLPSLFLLEMLIKNCGLRFAQVVASNKGIFTQLESMLQWLQRRIRAKEPGSIRASHKALELIQAWGEEFLPMRSSHGLEAFVSLYHKLRASGFKFTAPQLDASRPPIFTPPSTAAPAPAAAAATAGPRSSSGQHTPTTASSGRSGGGGSGGGSSTGLPSSLVPLENAASMLRDIVLAATSAEEAMEGGLLRDLARTVKAGVPDLQRRLEAATSGSGSADLGALLALNDLVHGAQRVLVALVKGGTSAASEEAKRSGLTTAPAPAAPPAATTAVSRPSPADDGFGDLFGSDSPPAAAASPASAPSAKPEQQQASAADDDMLGDLFGGAPAAAAPPALSHSPQSDPFGAAPAPPPPASAGPADAAPHASDDFDDFDPRGTGSVPTSRAPAPAAAPAPAPNPFDMFD